MLLKKKTIRAFDLFSGVGGFRLAAENFFSKYNIRVKTVGFSEIDKNAKLTYISNWPSAKEETYISDITAVTRNYNNEIMEPNIINATIPDHDILFAGFPCQPFSIMGKEKGFNDDRGTLFFDIHKILGTKRPKYFILENVQRIKTIQNGQVFETIKNILEKELGYCLFTYVLNTSDYGLPQIRRRVYFVGIMNPNKEQLKRMECPPPTIKSELTAYPTTYHILSRNVDRRYYLSDKLKKTILSNGTGGWYAKAEIDRMIARPLCKTMHKMHRASQDNYYSDSYLNAVYKNGLLLREKSSIKNIRRLTPFEAFKLQGFSEEFVRNALNAGVSETQLYMQAGNAVSVPVVEAVLKHIFE